MYKALNGEYPPPGSEAHHVLPQQFESWFQQHGVNIHHPSFGRMLTQAEHRFLHGTKGGNYNRLWEIEIKNFNLMAREGQTVTPQMILAKGKELMARSNLTVNY